MENTPSIHPKRPSNHYIKIVTKGNKLSQEDFDSYLQARTVSNWKHIPQDKILSIISMLLIIIGAWFTIEMKYPIAYAAIRHYIE